MYQRIVVPLDGSDAAEVALKQAERLAREHDAPLHLIRVIDLAAGHSYYTFLAIEATGHDQAIARAENIARRYLEDLHNQLASRGMRVTIATPRGPAVREIVNGARSGDVIVMASRGRGGGPRCFLGRVAEEIVRRSRVPVQLVQATQVTPAIAPSTIAHAAEARV